MSPEHTTPLKQAAGVDKSAPHRMYSPAILVGDLMFVSSQGPLNPGTKTFESYDVEHQTRLTLHNLQRIPVGADSSLQDAVKVKVHLQNINDIAQFNAIYGEYFAPPRPARTTVQSVIGAGVSLEIDAIAVRGCGDFDGGRP